MLKLRTVVRDADPGVFSLVMATCIVSRAMQLDGAARLSGILLAAGIAAYVLLAAVYAGRLAVNRGGVRANATVQPADGRDACRDGGLVGDALGVRYLAGAPPDHPGHLAACFGAGCHWHTSRGCGASCSRSGCTVWPAAS